MPGTPSRTRNTEDERRDVETLPVRVTESHIRGMPRHLDAAEQRTIRCDDVNAGRARAVDVALAVHFHPVRNARLGSDELVKQTRILHAAVGLHIPHANEVLPRVVDVEKRFVGRESEAVRIDAVFDDERRLPRGRNAEDAVEIEIALHVLTVHLHVEERAGRIREIDAAVGLHHDVVRRVELLPVPLRAQCRDRAVELHAPDAPPAPAGDEEASFLVEGHAVGLVARPHDDLPLPPRRALPDRIADDVDPEELTGALVPHGTFSEVKVVCDHFELRVTRQDALETRSGHIEFHGPPLDMRLARRAMNDQAFFVASPIIQQLR